MANENVVDELVVKLRLDAEAYQDVQAEVDARASETEKKEKDKDGKRKTRERDQSSRMKGLTSTAKSLGVALAAVAGFVAAVGAAVVGSLTGLNALEVSLTRNGVATGLSNREMQAWGSTARRMGADADAGASAIADLAREQKQVNLGGDAHTLQALSRIGVRVGTDIPIQDMLAQAQQVYKNAPTAQKGQIESVLSASNVNTDLIVMIKSETDVREAFTKSLQQATAENTKALEEFRDATAAAKDNAISIANSLATVLEPGIKSAAQWFNTVAIDASRFSERVVAAGGGVDGFLKVLNEESPILGKAASELGKSLKTLGEVVDVVAYGLQEIGKWLKSGNNWVDKQIAQTAQTAPDTWYGKLAAKYQAADQSFQQWQVDLWSETVDNARANGPAPVASLMSGPTGAASVTSGAQGIMGQLVSKYGLSVDDAAAVTANLNAESGLRANAYNPAGGGQGARGIAQWRGDRIDAFRKRYGMNPDAATVDQQLEFMMTDPYERALLMRSLAGGADATLKGAAVSRGFEAHGDPQEDARRGAQAAALASSYTARAPYLSNAAALAGPAAGAGSGPAVQITGPVTVVANNPQELVTGLQRQSNVQNQNSAVR